MPKKIMSNKDLESFVKTGSHAVEGEGNPWENFNPAEKRVGVSAYNIALNRYEKSIIDAAALKEGGASSAFMRQASLKRAKTILGIN